MFRTIFLTALLASALTGCATSIDVTSDYYRKANFSSYQTFSFLPERTLMVQSAEPVSPMLEGRLKAAAAEALTRKGFRQTDNPDEADFLLAFNLGARDQLSVNNYPDPNRESWYPDPSQESRRWNGPDMGAMEVRTLTEGTLSIDMFEAKTRQPVWYGSATKTLSDSDRGNAALIKQVVAAILQKFPPG